MDTEQTCTFIRKSVGSTIERLCAERGLKQTSFAQMVSVDRSYLNQIISGKKNASLNVLVKIADGLDVPLTELFFGLDEVSPREAARRGLEYDGRMRREDDAQ